MSIRFLDMFAGIGGFRSGLMAVGGFECVGHCEIDKYANQAYNAIYEPKGEQYYDDARTIDPDALPDIDLICGGFPCQSFSIAGKRFGFADDTRGTLFFEIVRITAARRPAYLLLENVPGLLSHDAGRTFETIIAALVELGYGVEWAVYNSADFGVPQQQRRLYIVASLGGNGTRKIFSLDSSNAKNIKEIIPGRQGQRVLDPSGVACTQIAGSGGGSSTGLYFIDMNTPILSSPITRRYPILQKRNNCSSVFEIQTESRWKQHRFFRDKGGAARIFFSAVDKPATCKFKANVRPLFRDSFLFIVGSLLPGHHGNFFCCAAIF